jgi:hypothetical protein
MIFHRSTPARPYQNYRDYRSLLRQDFRYRCAYCLLHEYFLGGEAGCCIDHHRPIQGPSARPDLISEYSNLYWCCRECNENKGDTWPSAEDYAAGLRFLDPCQPEDDHDRHWRVRPDGVLEPLTPTGRYTIRRLRLWRPFLQHHREQLFHLQEEVLALENRLSAKTLSDGERIRIEQRLTELQRRLEPPVFDRPRFDPSEIE